MHGFIVGTVLTCLICVSCTQAPVGVIDARARNRLDSLARDFELGKIAQIEVYQISLSKVFIASVSPETLDLAWDCKVQIRHDLDLRRPKVASALRNAVVTSSSTPGDLRWKFAFYSADAKELGVLYFDGLGRKGLVGNELVSYRMDFLFRLRQAVDPYFEILPQL